jgi:hypothetical protein
MITSIIERTFVSNKATAQLSNRPGQMMEKMAYALEPLRLRSYYCGMLLMGNGRVE